MATTQDKVYYIQRHLKLTSLALLLGTSYANIKAYAYGIRKTLDSDIVRKIDIYYDECKEFEKRVKERCKQIDKPA